MDNRTKGSWGEERAARYLRLRAYRILAKNFRCRLGEIDLIASRGRFLVFAEVKLRKSDRFAEAREFVTRAKQERILATAQLWMQEHETSLQPRFDVIEIYAPDGPEGRVRVNHIENAFAV